MICVILSGALGDFVLALPALMRLRSCFPESRIHLVGNPVWLPLVEETVAVDQSFSLENLSLHQGFMQRLSDHQRLFRFLDGYDLIVSWFGDREGRWKKNLCEAFPGRARVFPFHRHDRFPGHVSEFYLNTLASSGITNPCDGQDPSPWPAIRRWAPFHGRGQGFIIHPGSGSPGKNWPAGHYRTVAESVLCEGKMPVRILLGPAEEDQRPFWQSASGARFTVQKDRSLEEVSHSLAESSLYLGNDSGITHLAASLGVPTLALFGPTDPLLWAPRGPRVRILHVPGQKEPSEVTGEPPSGAPCRPPAMKPEDVVASLRELRDATEKLP